MESKEESTDDIPGHKNSKRKYLKFRHIRRSKRTGAEENPKLSQSASDITAGKELGSDENLACSEGLMGSRALSHDSIFLAAQAQTDDEPGRVLSQENVHSKIKALQMKLQLQKMHFGPPAMFLPVKNPEEVGSRSEDSLHHSSYHSSGEDVTLTTTTSQPVSCSLSPTIKFAPNKSLPPTQSRPFSLSGPPNSSSSNVEVPSDFGTPAQFPGCLDTSAARHRMSIKPRNQRASMKKKPSSVSQSDFPLHTLNNIDYPMKNSMKEQKRELVVQKKETVTLEEVPKLSSQSFAHQNQALPGIGASQVQWVKSPSLVDPVSSGRPHSSFMESEIKGKKESDLEKRIVFHDETNTLYKAETAELSPDQLSTTLGSVVASELSSANQHLRGEDKITRGLIRPAARSGSFHSSINTSKIQDWERPQSGSFLGELGKIEARHKATDETDEKRMREKEELALRRGSPYAVGELRQEGAPTKRSAIPWDRKESLKKVKSVTPSKDVPTDTYALEAEEVDSSQEPVEEAEEAKEIQEEQGKTAFGIRLRATSQSLKLRSETASDRHSKTEQCEEQGDKQKIQEISDNAKQMSEKLPANKSCALRPTDPVTSGISPPVKHNTPLSSSLQTKLTEVKTSSSNPKEAETTIQEPEPGPQRSSSEVSWISLAMEKTRSLQQLFTSRFPRDFTGVQTAAQPQAQVQPTNQTEATGMLQTANQAPAHTVIEESFQSRTQAQSVNPSMQQKRAATSPLHSKTSRESQMSKQITEDQSQPNTTQSVSHAASHPTVQTIPWTTQSPVRTSLQTTTTSELAQKNTSQSLAQSYLSSGQHQPSWSNRGLQPATQLKPTTSASVSSAAVPTSDSALESGERDGPLQKEGLSLSIRRAVWTGSVSERAAFLEKRGEWATPSLLKVEQRKAQIETQTSGDPPSSPKNIHSNNPIAEGRQEMKPAESSPIKVLERLEKLREDRWLPKNVGSSSSQPPSPTQPSVLQSMSDSGQPSWMELAKRKSMAWSDKTMD
ncbi:uncharacterized protein cracdla [Leuresthes tenuis]|uniref:uncharacterized protein cracdla n=1 Tax=Leuresthes tenuis TaxID=355514 RepID=UPI003B508D3D